MQPTAPSPEPAPLGEDTHLVFATISVIVTTKNNARTIDACLQSIANQTFPRLELIVVDNSSTDQTPTLATHAGAQLFTFGPERTAQRNYGVSKAGGDCVLIIDADMVLSPTVVSDCMALVNEQYEAAIIPIESFGDGYWAQCKALEHSLFDGAAGSEAPRFFTRSLYQAIGGYDETVTSGEDTTLHHRVASQTQIARITAPLRRDEGTLTLRQIIAAREHHELASLSQILGHPLRLFRSPLLGIGVLIIVVTGMLAPRARA